MTHIQRLRYRQHVTCVLHNKKEQQMLKKSPLNFFTYKIQYHMYNQLSIKKYIYLLHSINTLSRRNAQVFHRMGRLVSEWVLMHQLSISCDKIFELYPYICPCDLDHLWNGYYWGGGGLYFTKFNTSHWFSFFLSLCISLSFYECIYLFWMLLFFLYFSV